MTARRAPRVPSYRLHKPSGQAVVRLSGRDVYLGPHGSPESRTEYERVVGEWLANGRRAPETRRGATAGRTITEIVVAYTEYAQAVYPAATVDKGVRPAMRRLRQVYGATDAGGFDAASLKALRERMIGEGLSRQHVNKLTAWIKRGLKWAATERLIPLTTYQSVALVDGLRRGRSAARESDARPPADPKIVEQTLPHLPPVLADVCRLLMLTGARPAEILNLTPRMIDQSGRVWTARLTEHKTDRLGRERVIHFGPQSQAILSRHTGAGLALDDPIFSPRRSEAARREALSAARTTPLSCGNKPGSNRRRRPKRQPGDRYTPERLYLAVQRACGRAFGVDESGKPRTRWAPYALRKLAATRVRDGFGLDAASAYLGHANLETTTIHYAARSDRLAEEVARKVG